MDIKLILENQLVIMQSMLELQNMLHGTTGWDLIEQVKKTKERIDNWGPGLKVVK